MLKCFHHPSAYPAPYLLRHVRHPSASLGGEPYVECILGVMRRCGETQFYKGHSLLGATATERPRDGLPDRGEGSGAQSNNEDPPQSAILIQSDSTPCCYCPKKGSKNPRTNDKILEVLTLVNMKKIASHAKHIMGTMNRRADSLSRHMGTQSYSLRNSLFRHLCTRPST